MIEFGSWGWLPGFVFISAAAFRLARFNITAKLETKSNFIGIPVPAAAVTLASFVIFCEAIWGEIRLDRFLLIMVVMFSALMVSTIEYETMPGFDLSNKRNRIKMLMLGVVGLALNRENADNAISFVGGVFAIGNSQICGRACK